MKSKIDIKERGKTVEFPPKFYKLLKAVAKYEEKYSELDDEELKQLLTKVKLILEEIEYDLFRNIVVK